MKLRRERDHGAVIRMCLRASMGKHSAAAPSVARSFGNQWRAEKIHPVGLEQPMEPLHLFIGVSLVDHIPPSWQVLVIADSSSRNVRVKEIFRRKRFFRGMMPDNSISNIRRDAPRIRFAAEFDVLTKSVVSCDDAQSNGRARYLSAIGESRWGRVVDSPDALCAAPAQLLF